MIKKKNEKNAGSFAFLHFFVDGTPKIHENMKKYKKNAILATEDQITIINTS